MWFLSLFFRVIFSDLLTIFDGGVEMSGKLHSARISVKVSHGTYLRRHLSKCKHPKPYSVSTEYTDNLLNLRLDIGCGECPFVQRMSVCDAEMYLD